MLFFIIFSKHEVSLQLKLTRFLPMATYLAIYIQVIESRELIQKCINSKLRNQKFTLFIIMINTLLISLQNLKYITTSLTNPMPHNKNKDQNIKNVIKVQRAPKVRCIWLKRSLNSSIIIFCSRMNNWLSLSGSEEWYTILISWWKFNSSRLLIIKTLH